MNHIGVLPYTSYRALESQADDADTGVDFTLTLHKSGLEHVLAVKPPSEARR